MPETLDKNGYTPWHKAFSGNVAGKPRGLLPLDKPATAFRYSHSLQRLQQLSQSAVDGQLYAGFSTVQLESPGGKILFEQSVMLGLNVISGAGGLLGTWYIHNDWTYKFKTRICDGQFVLPLVEPHEEGHGPPPEPPLHKPGIPDVPRLFNVKVTSLTVQTPSELPERAVSFALQYSTERYRGWKPFAKEIPPDTAVNVDVTNWGITSTNPLVAPTEKVWFRCLAIGIDNATEGEAVRDTWPTIISATAAEGGTGGAKQIAGYEGWRHLDFPRPTPYSEQGILENPEGSGQLVVGIFPEWGSPAWGYNCKLPVGTRLDIVSDYWVGQLSQNDIYYSFAWKPGAPPEAMLCCAPMGEHLWFYQQDSTLYAARVRRLEDFRQRKLADVGMVQPASLAQNSTVSGIWGALGGLEPYSAFAAGDTLYIAQTRDRGRNWEDAMKVLDGVETLALWSAEGGAAVCVIGRATKAEAASKVASDDIVTALLRQSADGSWTRTRFEKTTNGKNAPWDARLVGVTHPEGAGSSGAGTAWLWFATGDAGDELECYQTTDYGFTLQAHSQDLPNGGGS